MKPSTFMSWQRWTPTRRHGRCRYSQPPTVRCLKRVFNLCIRSDRRGTRLNIVRSTWIRTYTARLIVADIRQPLLGADFFRQHNLLVDLRRERLIERDTFLSCPCTVGVTSVTESNKFRKILQEFPAILQPTFSSASVKHGVEHNVLTTGPPVHARARRLAPDKLAVAKREFLEMEKMGIIRKSNSPRASPLHIVHKPNGGWRPCGDYRRLNDVTTPDRYPIPHIQDYSAQLSVKAIKDFPRPLTVKKLQEFLGMINFYNRFIKNAFAILKPLYEAQGKSKPQEPLDWSDVMTEAFSSSKTALVNATMLTHPAHGAPIALTSDASDVAVGGVLEQLSKGSWQPLAFFSKQLRPAEKKYSTFDRELLGLYLAVKYFRYFFEGRRFAMFTDHKPLVGAMSKLSDPWTARQQRYLAHISEFSTDIRHISGKANVVADCLSRATINVVVLGIDYKAIAEAQEHDEEIQALKTAITGLNLQSVQISNDGPKLLCDVSTGNPRPIVPKAFQRQVFETIHNLAHPSRKSTVKLVTQKFVWRGLKKNKSHNGHRSV
ncbi:Pol polyprotein [Elysia marginata]|uniref:Pol polyprotein n=1 Tax=Elysia marginata TaxID=1093978 RepID=A0AAV4JYK4_9GAST|nr:Pol polyprotein [Elysia marginata]